MKIPADIYPFKPKSKNVKGHNLSYIDEGQGSTVVMLHGNPTWSFYYRNLAAALRDTHRVIVPDHMGCGFSDKPQDYPYRLIDHIDNLEVLLDELEGKVSLVVHDWGGAIGFGYAARHPEKIQSLTVLNTAAFPSKHIPWQIQICKIPWLGEIIVRGFNGFAWPATFMAVARKKMAKEIKNGFLAPYRNWHDRIANHRFVKDIPLNENHPSWQTLLDVENGLAKLKEKPMIILWGGRDFCFNDYFYQEWCERFPSAEKHYFKDAGHYILEDAYDEVRPLISDFLKRNG